MIAIYFEVPRKFQVTADAVCCRLMIHIFGNF